MGNTGEDVDASSLMKMEKKKKKKKSKNKTNDGDDNIHGGLQKEKLHKHSKKKGKSESNEDVDVEDNGDIQKKRKREKTQTNENDDDSKPKKHKKKKSKSKSIEDVEVDNGKILEDNGDLQKKKKKKKKKKKNEDSSEKTQTKENEQPEKHKKKKRKSKSNEDGGDKGENLEDNGDVQTKPKKKKTKKVTFSGEVEIFPSPTTKKAKNQESDDNLVRGKRFTPEEDEIVKQAVNDYIISNNLGDDGLKMILNCKSHKGMSKCWQEIGTCIPYRPYTAIYYRAHILFEQSEHRQWTPEEIKFLKESYKKHGNKWKMIAEELGKHRFHVKDTWRRIKLDGLKSGKWSQDEYQGLYDMVNLDLQMKVTGEENKKSKHGMLRDNIPWTAISEKLETRSDATCCRKWYEQLTSSLVAEKKWSDADDYWLIGRLYEIDAACVEDVEWDDVLEHRSGEICRKRWDQMVVRIEDHKSKTFGEQVEILAKRYRPELAEARQTWDDKPVVP